MDLSNLSYVDSSFHVETYKRCSPKIGDVLLTKDGANTGNVAINVVGEPFSLLSSVAMLRPCKEKLTSKFLLYYLQSADGLQQITGQMTGTAIKRIILRDLRASTITMPPLQEQERIVDVLDSAFQIIGKQTRAVLTSSDECDSLARFTHRKLALLGELRESLLHAAFTGKL